MEKECENLLEIAEGPSICLDNDEGIAHQEIDLSPRDTESKKKDMCEATDFIEPPVEE